MNSELRERIIRELDLDEDFVYEDDDEDDECVDDGMVHIIRQNVRFVIVYDQMTVSDDKLERVDMPMWAKKIDKIINR